MTVAFLLLLFWCHYCTASIPLIWRLTVEWWDHPLKTLNAPFFDPFPLSKVQEQRKKEPAAVEEIPVICECRMPWDNCDKRSPSLWCAECDSCKEWYHRKCVPKIPHMIFKGSNATWLCPKCEKALAKGKEKCKPSEFFWNILKLRYSIFTWFMQV